MARIELTVDPEIDANFPGRRAARVTVTTHDGRTASHLQPTRKGDPELPLSDADLDDKFIELAGRGDIDPGAELLRARESGTIRIERVDVDRVGQERGSDDER